jgi:2,5-furandicarboxylate decarboxylase 1
MAKNLTQFLSMIEKDFPELLLRIKEEVDPGHFEISSLLSLLEKTGQEKIVLFEKALSIEKRGTMALASNLFVSRKVCALALGLAPQNHGMGLVEEFAARERAAGSMMRVPASDAPCQQVVWEGESADLMKLPVPVNHEKDAGPYLTMACIMKGLDRDFYDITFTKNLVKDAKRMSVSAHAHHHLEAILAEYEAKNMRAPMIVVLGHHPAFYLSSCCLMPYGNNDYLTSSAFLQEPLRVTASRTWGDTFLVPADAEIIVEAEILPGVREKQNPYGEIAGYYQPEMLVPVAEVTAITMKKGAIMQTVFPGHNEHFHLGGIPKEGSVYGVIKRNIPGVKAVHLPPSACGRFSCTISMEKEFENEPRKAAMAAFTEMPNLKLAIVVDDDIDVYDEREVQWAVVTRTHWDKDVEIIRKVQSFRGWLGDAVAIIDATRPDDVNFPERNRIPAEALRRAEERWKL